MGGSGSKMEKALVDFPDGERYFGLENFGNTCYANSVLQALYFCRPFRGRVLEYAAQRLPVRDADENLLTCLAELFVQAGHLRLCCCCAASASSKAVLSLKVTTPKKLSHCICQTYC